MSDDNPFRQFYAEGGYTGSPTDRQRQTLRLWASQYMAKGGSVGDKGSVDRLVEAMIALHRACGGRV